jgi:hypothetical protein
LTRPVAAALLVALVSSTSSARAEDLPLRGGLYGGSYYGFALGGSASFDSTQYVTLGGFADHEWVHVSVETPGPFLLIDGLAGLVAFLAGEDVGVPLYSALNGERDAGRFRMIDVEGAIRVLRAGPHKLELGVHGDFSLLQAYSDGVRLGSDVFDLGPTVGYAFATRDVVFRAAATAGNGFGSERTGNPFVGGSTFASVRVYDVFGLTARFDAVAQELDVGTLEPYPVDGSQDRIVEWAAFGTTTFGLTGLLD